MVDRILFDGFLLSIFFFTEKYSTKYLRLSVLVTIYFWFALSINQILLFFVFLLLMRCGIFICSEILVYS